jgi:hypothetical protein
MEISKTNKQKEAGLRSKSEIDGDAHHLVQCIQGLQIPRRRRSEHQSLPTLCGSHPWSVRAQSRFCNSG